MLLGNMIITVVNHWKQDGSTVYCCHRLGGCSWYSQQNRTQDTPGQKPDTIHRIRIPAAQNGDNYCGTFTWQSLTTEERKKRWTLGQDTLLVPGCVDVTSDEEYRRLRRSGETAANLSWHNNARGITPHWYVEGS